MKSPRYRLADRKAELLSRWVKAAPDEWLEAVMRGLLRRVLLWQIFRTMRQRVDPDRGWGGDAVVEFRIRRYRADGVDRYQLVIAEGRCTTTRSAKRAPTLTLEMPPVVFLRLVGGAASAPALILTRKLRVSGDLVLAARLPTLLKTPRPTSRARD